MNIQCKLNELDVRIAFLTALHSKQQRHAKHYAETNKPEVLGQYWKTAADETQKNINDLKQQKKTLRLQTDDLCGTLSPATPVELQNDIQELGDDIQRDIKDGTCFHDQDKLQAFVASLNQLEIKTLQCWAANQETSE